MKKSSVFHRYGHLSVQPVSSAVARTALLGSHVTSSLKASAATAATEPSVMLVLVPIPYRGAAVGGGGVNVIH